MMNPNPGELNTLGCSATSSREWDAVELQHIRGLNDDAAILRHVQDIRQQAPLDTFRVTARRLKRKWKVALGLGGLSLIGLCAGSYWVGDGLLNSAVGKPTVHGLLGPIPSSGMAAGRPTMHAQRLDHRLARVVNTTPSRVDTEGTASPATLSQPDVIRVEVARGRAMTVTDPDSVLFTQGLFGCSALAVLSGGNGQFYARRTLMHFTAHSLRYGLADDINAAALIAVLQDEINQSGGKVIWIRGMDYANHDDLGLELGQSDAEGKQPILDLMSTTGVSLMLAESPDITIYPDGQVELQGNHGQRHLCPEREHCEYIFAE